MRKSNDRHWMIEGCYYAGVIIASAFFSSFLALILSFSEAILALFITRRYQLIGRTIRFLLIVAVCNLVFGGGEDVIWRWWWFSISHTGILYAVRMVLRIGAILCWVYLATEEWKKRGSKGGFSRAFPGITLFLLAASRQMVRMRRMIQKIPDTRKAAGVRSHPFSEAMTILLMVMEKALREGLCQVDSMRSRGYGLANIRRTTLQRESWRRKDSIVGIGLFLIAVIAAYCAHQQYVVGFMLSLAVLFARPCVRESVFRRCGKLRAVTR